MPNSDQRLLTIAIPTWNRAEKIKTALEVLLPQMIGFEEKIELVISDNASQDNTAEIVNGLKDKFNSFSFVFHQQKQNTGFFGNFHKCVELANGRYFWLLSDDDFLFPGTLDMVIKSLIGTEVGAVFLKDWSSDKNSVEEHYSKVVNKESFFSDDPFRNSLISSVIYKNDISVNDAIFTDLKGNALIGYANFLKCASAYDRFVIICGNSLLVKNDNNVRFNALKIFTDELKEVVDYVHPFYSKKIIRNINNSFLKSLISVHLVDYKFNNKYRDFVFSFGHFFRNYWRYKNFWIFNFPLLLMNKYFYNKIRSLKKKIIK